MPFDLWARMGPRNHVLYGVHIPHGKGQFWGKGAPIVKYRDFMPWAVQKRLNQLIIRLGCGLGLAKGSTNSVVFTRWWQFVRQHSAMPWAVRKQLNWSICRLGCGLGWAEGSTSSPGGANVPSWEGTLVLHGEYDWIVCLWRPYFDQLLLYCLSLSCVV